MTNSRWPLALVRVFHVLTLVLVVILGFYSNLILSSTEFFVADDRFGDLLGHAAVCKDLEYFSNKWRGGAFNYFPLACLRFTQLSWQTTYCMYVFFFILSTLLCVLAIYKVFQVEYFSSKSTSLSKVLAICSVAFSLPLYPLAFTIDRGNIELLLISLFFLAFTCDLTASRFFRSRLTLRILLNSVSVFLLGYCLGLKISSLFLIIPYICLSSYSSLKRLLVFLSAFVLNLFTLHMSGYSISDAYSFYLRSGFTPGSDDQFHDYTTSLYSLVPWLDVSVWNYLSILLIAVIFVYTYVKGASGAEANARGVLGSLIVSSLIYCLLPSWSKYYKLAIFYPFYIFLLTSSIDICRIRASYRPISFLRPLIALSLLLGISPHLAITIHWLRFPSQVWLSIGVVLSFFMINRRLFSSLQDLTCILRKKKPAMSDSRTQAN